MSAVQGTGDPAGPALGAEPGSVATGPSTLAEACALLDDPGNQGLPLTRRDYLYLVLVTVALPLVLILIGVLT